MLPSIHAITQQQRQEDLQPQESTDFECVSAAPRVGDMVRYEPGILSLAPVKELGYRNILHVWNSPRVCGA